ncbi:MAG: UDP-N-acetylglucosamine 2-epimerase (non-hydrolyzing) [Elusimicrobia bacterium]|nr:UDP-N-acetylglucosamine 2-epimerase (non-hydrolyzing) [Elusimicrobiota bacterium]
MSAKLLVVAGTRPEAIKLAPVIAALRRLKGLSVRVCATAQHRELLDGMLDAFGIRPDIDLDLMRPRQSPGEVLRRCRKALAPVLARERPDLVIVQGDTTSALGAALAAKDAGVCVAHVEAGLRTHDPRQPFPEERNRVRIDRISRLWFAPTIGAARNLRREGLGPDGIFVTGNTSIDALLWALRRPGPPENRSLARLPQKRLVVVTLHRRESFGRALDGLMRAIGQASARLPGWTWVLPVHPNPRVRRAARRLAGRSAVKLIAPLGYLDFVKLMKRADFLVTDSGGIQEEAPTLKKPVLVVRNKTERPELLGRGGKLIGNSGARLLRELTRWARGRRPKPPARNPFGDGRAARRIARALSAWARAKRPRP